MRQVRNGFRVVRLIGDPVGLAFATRVGAAAGVDAAFTLWRSCIHLNRFRTSDFDGSPDARNSMTGGSPSWNSCDGNCGPNVVTIFRNAPARSSLIPCGSKTKAGWHFCKEKTRAIPHFEFPTLLNV